MGATPKSRRERLTELEKKGEIGCGYCPPHDKENRGRRPKDDKHKNKRKS